MLLPAFTLLMLGAPLALAGTSCLGHLDENDTWHPGFGCQPFTFCCGTCHRRFCCRDPSLAISESRQKQCLRFSHKVVAGVASALILFVAVVATALCCFFCTCRYLSRRRQRLQSPFAGMDSAGLSVGQAGPNLGAAGAPGCEPIHTPAGGAHGCWHVASDVPRVPPVSGACACAGPAGTGCR
ncbi:protein shisa-4 isoform X1 [Desmodus rotundus]|uniref:protein shisa-4 isoform X1 n=1 Tax=Desmodus rotundus TaxID=9430 RepID=UPI0023812722|nr:protein shisa-4 isoform X1 [Desmodus rotundus]